jgi:hypothetical protein
MRRLNYGKRAWGLRANLVFRISDDFVALARVVWGLDFARIGQGAKDSLSA